MLVSTYLGWDQGRAVAPRKGLDVGSWLDCGLVELGQGYWVRYITYWCFINAKTCQDLIIEWGNIELTKQAMIIGCKLARLAYVYWYFRPKLVESTSYYVKSCAKFSCAWVPDLGLSLFLFYCWRHSLCTCWNESETTKLKLRAVIIICTNQKYTLCSLFGPIGTFPHCLFGEKS